MMLTVRGDCLCSAVNWELEFMLVKVLGDSENNDRFLVRISEQLRRRLLRYGETNQTIKIDNVGS